MKNIVTICCLSLALLSCTHKGADLSELNTEPTYGVTKLNSEWPVPFVLPYDDGSPGITNFGSKLNHKPAGKYGPVKVSEDGHFSVGDQRIRFWGVNVTGRSCFPDKKEADKIAARMAKFGINIVRFHHMENNWGGSTLIDYGPSGSRKLNEHVLDRLDYFIAKLKDHGIYSNINLMTSREFFPSDGLPKSVMELDWKQRHILSYLLTDQRNLEKEYAKTLLNHLNPYTKLPYNQDPAIAFVEINNENSIYQQYFSGTLDKAPLEFTQLLTQRWNDWLASQYKNDQILYQEWGVIDEALGKEIILNGGLAENSDHWRVEQHGGALVNHKIVKVKGKRALRLKVSKRGSQRWNVQLNQKGLALKKNRVYTLKFSAKANKHKNLSVSIQQAYKPWTTYDQIEYKLSKNWQDYELTFLSPVNDDNLRLNFGSLGSKKGQFFIREVSLKPGGSLGKLPLDQNLENRTISRNLYNKRYNARNKDWMRFLKSLEMDYWGDMNDFIKNEIKIAGLSYGTIVSLSPPSVQKQFNFIDGHSYWDHPIFHNRDWDSKDWTIQNNSMVNSFSNSIDDLAQQRVIGMPFTVSEFQSAKPNHFSAEAPLMIAAYAGLQDWDAIYFFAYGANRRGNWDDNYFSDYFETNNIPSTMVNMAVAANLFRRGDVHASKKMLAIPFDEQQELDVLATKAHAWHVATGKHLESYSGKSFLNRVGLDLNLDASSGITTKETISDIKLSDTGQIKWDLRNRNAGVLSINTDKTKSIVGFIEGQEYQFDSLTVEIGQLNLNWATLTISAQSGNLDNLDAGASILAIATGRTENTKMKWTDKQQISVGSNWGRAPTLVEVIPFSIALKASPSNVKAWSLSPEGARKQNLAVETTNTGARIIADGTHKTLWYEIEVKPN